MISSPITLATDVLGDDVLVNESYERLTPISTTFVGPGHSFADSTVDELTIQTKQPRPTATFRGNIRSYVKFQKTVDLSETETSKIIVEVTMTVPVGAPPEDVLHMRQKLIALYDNSTIMDDIFERGEC